MITRISKIARLPATIREQLNLRLHNGQFGRKILPWLNGLPETKEVLAENFDGHAITHQNLSEWRRSGYQDWLFHQDRLQWFSRLHEEDAELSVHDSCPDTYEAMSRYFLFEIGQAMRDAQKIKNPDARWERMERLTEKFARLQNAYNLSRRVAFEYDKYNGPEPEEPEESEPESPEHPDGSDNAQEKGDRARPGRSETRPRVSLRGSESSNGLVPSTASEVRREAHQTATEAAALPESQPDQTERQDAGAPQNAPRTSTVEDQPASPAIAGDCASPLPLSDINSSTPKLINSLPPPSFAPIPPLAPTTTPSAPNIPLSPRPFKPHTSPPPIRGRRFVCVEG